MAAWLRLPARRIQKPLLYGNRTVYRTRSPTSNEEGLGRTGRIESLVGRIQHTDWNWNWISTPQDRIAAQSTASERDATPPQTLAARIPRTLTPSSPVQLPPCSTSPGRRLRRRPTQVPGQPMADKDKGKGTDGPGGGAGAGAERGGPAPTPPSPPTDWRTVALHLGSKVTQFGSVLHLVSGRKQRFRGYAVKKRMDNFRQAPGLFRDIGQDAKGLLLLDFMADNLMMDENTKPSCKLMCGAGITSSRDFPVRKLFVRAKHANTTVDVNATTNANAITKFTFDGIFGPKTRGILSIPLPNGQSKFELQALRPTFGLTAATTLDSPLEVSCLIGSKLFSLGGSFEAVYDKDSQSYTFGHSIGLAAKFPSTSVSLIMDHNRTVTATAVRDFPSWRTSFGLMAKHHLVDPSNHQVPTGAFEDAAVVVGVRHRLGQALSLKVRASSNLFASAVVKASFRRRLSVALSGEMNLRNIGQDPKVGVVLSFP